LMQCLGKTKTSTKPDHKSRRRITDEEFVP
jgi:hypothetical protein